MADSKDMAESTETNDAPLVTAASTTATVQTESDSTTADSLRASNLGKSFTELPINYFVHVL